MIPNNSPIFQFFRFGWARSKMLEVDVLAVVNGKHR